MRSIGYGGGGGGGDGRTHITAVVVYADGMA